MKCIVCDYDFGTVHCYGEFQCPGCGQWYEYDEGVTIRLNKEQLRLLREHAAPKPTEEALERLGQWKEVARKVNERN